MDKSYAYPGDELSLFAAAVRWKTYLKQEIHPWLQGDVLEVGAGIGSTTKMLHDDRMVTWTALEPDEKLFEQLCRRDDLSHIIPLRGTINDVPDHAFDSILYIDVLEHIERDRDELKQSASKLKKGGNIIVLSPAWNHLYSPFDKVIGHYRRYTKSSLKALKPEGLQLKRIKYLDSAGYFASLANKWFLHQPYPSKKQVLFWDRTLVPLSRIVDPLFFHSFGKSILAVWEK
jgi:2-polyprenyl-3-methyl-5-hydroxy-6-metoxy-1,4-benzoquinol methylase